MPSEYELLKAEREKLEIELLKEQLEKSRRAKEQKELIRQQQKLQYEQQKFEELQRQENCNHRKGGINAEDFRSGKGTLAQYAVNNQTTPCGEVYRMCLRCMKEWHPPNCKCEPNKACTEKEYREAMSWPTDNTPSQSVTFNIPERKTA